MLTYRFVKDIHDARIREIERAAAHRSELPESEQTQMIRRRALREARLGIAEHHGRLACTCG
jgi:hypothetical protein